MNRAGRPLGVAIGSGTVDIAPGAGWTFETDTVDAHGIDYVAYPAGALGN